MKAQHDPFVDIDVSHRNVDRWIARAAVRDFIRSKYPMLSGALLDVGCGRSPYRRDILANSGVESHTGMDLETALVYDANLRPDVYWDGVTMPFPDARFDCALATEVLEHVADLPRLLMEIKRVLRPGGVLVFTTTFIWPYHETPHDRQRWTSFGLRHHFEQAGFSTTEIVSTGNWHSSLAQFLGLWCGRAPMPELLRRILRRPVFRLQRLLLRWDGNSSDADNSMPRVVCGTAVAP